MIVTVSTEHDDTPSMVQPAGKLVAYVVNFTGAQPTLLFVKRKDTADVVATLGSATKISGDVTTSVGGTNEHGADGDGVTDLLDDNDVEAVKLGEAVGDGDVEIVTEIVPVAVDVAPHSAVTAPFALVLNKLDSELLVENTGAA